MKILIVEDEEMIADIISAGLTRTGYQCECVYDGAEAAGLLEEKRYDLILLDIMLPGADGYELMEYIKNYNTPVIFITARTRLEDKVRGFKLGADDYITKPFELAELTARVEAVLRRYGKSRDKIAVAGIEVDMESKKTAARWNSQLRSMICFCCFSETGILPFTGSAFMRKCGAGSSIRTAGRWISMCSA